MKIDVMNIDVMKLMTLGSRLAVGHVALDHGAQVRILAPQPCGF